MTKAAEQLAQALAFGPQRLTRQALLQYIEAQEKQARIDEKMGRCPLGARVRATAARRALELLNGRSQP